MLSYGLRVCAFVLLWACSAHCAADATQSSQTKLVQAGSNKIDPFGRLLWASLKKKISCPPQTPATAVLLIIGQSNSANYAERYYTSIHGGAVANLVGDDCYIAGSPLLGAAGVGGESFTLLGDKLIDAGLYKTVILVPAGIGGSSVSQWQTGGDLGAMLMGVLAGAQRRYFITHVIWHQGETDYRYAMPELEYQRAFRSLVDSLRSRNVDAPIFVSVATRCVTPRFPDWNPDNAIAEAQRALPNPFIGVFAGVDTDALLGQGDRVGGCHFNASGQEKFANEWVRVIAKYNEWFLQHGAAPKSLEPVRSTHP